MKSHSLALLVLVSSLLSVSAQELRQWTDKASGNKIEASMVSADPTARTVTIQRKDGQSFTLPVDRLIDADLAYIKQQMTAPKVAPAPTAAPARERRLPRLRLQPPRRSHLHLQLPRAHLLQLAPWSPSFR